MTPDELRLIKPHPDHFWDGTFHIRVGRQAVEWTADTGQTIWLRAFHVGFPSRLHPADKAETMRIATFFLN